MSAVSPELENSLTIHHLPMTAGDEQAELIESLGAAQPTISPRFFYDRRGSELFDAITQTAEYYPTRTEAAIFSDYLPEMLAAGDCSLLLEPGSGNCGKAERFFETGLVDHYVPIEFSAGFLVDACRGLLRRHPGLNIDAVCADFTRCEMLPEAIPKAGRMLFFPGSTIGNFEPVEAITLLQRFHTLIGPGGHALIGVDMKKDAALLDAAYNDSQGLTAAFNLNALHHLNARLGCDFDPDAFAHHAFYNGEAGRVEMHLQCRRPTSVSIGDQCFKFAPGQSIHTENSWKYTPEEFQRLSARAGFATEQVWTDARDWFSVYLLRAE